jgi:potassium-dependent mechanosensitive channel
MMGSVMHHHAFARFPNQALAMFKAHFSRSAVLFGALLLAVVALLLLSPLSAQTPVSQRLDTASAAIASGEKEIETVRNDDAGLLRLRTKIDPVIDELRMVIGEQTPRLEGIKSRLEQLGPKPDASKNQSEAPEVARERDEQDKLRLETEAQIALARKHLVAGEQLTSAIADQRRTLLAKALLERSSSLLSPVLWISFIKALPGELTSARLLLGSWMDQVRSVLDGARLMLLAAAVGFSLLLALPGHRALRRFEGRPATAHDQTASTRLSKALAALRVTLIWAVVPAIICAGCFNILDAMGLLNDRVTPILRTLLYGVAFVAFSYGLADGLLAPEKPDWRLIGMEDATAGYLRSLALWFPAIIVMGKTVEAINQSIYAVLPVTVVTKGIFAALGALAILRTLRAISAAPSTQNEDTVGALAGGRALHALRIVAWTAAAIMLLAAALGYITLAGFLADQLLWLTMIGAGLVVCTILADEWIGKGLSPEGRIGGQIVTEVGVGKRSLKQISILGNGLVKVILIIAATMFALAPWGLDGGDTLGTMKAALFGFSVGGVTISLSSILFAIVLFALGYGITRAVRTWLERRFLPHTSMDQGLRNSIATSLGYIGIIAAAMVSASALGLSLDKFTIIAGALSVGIGFGLQSIINNFVSGLILLWERPIRVGDWIVVGDEQGLVKRINVRSTQIETFDRASLIVPNSEFISGRVKNWMHNDRLARIVIPIGVGYGSDPDKVRAILLDAAKANKAVLPDPHPRVYFMRLGDSSMEFELRCFVDVDMMLPVKSELMFDLLKRLRKARIDIPMPRRPQEYFNAQDEDKDGPELPERVVDEGRGKPRKA